MPSKGHDKSKGATGSTKKPLKELRGQRASGERDEGKLEHETETPDMSPSPGGRPEGQPREQQY